MPKDTKPPLPQIHTKFLERQSTLSLADQNLVPMEGTDMLEDVEVSTNGVAVNSQTEAEVVEELLAVEAQEHPPMLDCTKADIFPQNHSSTSTLYHTWTSVLHETRTLVLYLPSPSTHAFYPDLRFSFLGAKVQRTFLLTCYNALMPYSACVILHFQTDGLWLQL